MSELRVALTRYPHTAPLLDGEIRPEGVALNFEAISPIFPAFRRMARGLEFDVSEFGISTAVQAVSLGIGLRALPVFVTRRFDYDELYRDARSVSEPADLEGLRVGVRSWTVTDVVWARGALTDFFGLDPDGIELVVTGDEHLAEAKLPPNATAAPGASLTELLDRGEVAAILGHYDGRDPWVRPLIEEPAALEARWRAEHGAISMHHTVVVREDVLGANPGVGRALYDAFVAAKQPMLERLASGADVLAEDTSPTGPLHDFGVRSLDELARPDPLPYGVEANRSCVEAFLRYCHEQHLTTGRLSASDVFVDVSA